MGRLIERPDVTDKLILAYDGLIDIIKRGPTSTDYSDTLSLLESCLAYSDTIDLMATSFRMLRKVTTYKQSTQIFVIIKAESFITV